MNKVFIHIGYAKALSTTIQRDYFGIHPEINYCGIGCNDDILGYKSDTIERFFESGLKYENEFSWRKNIKMYKSDIHSLVGESDKKLVFSSEHLGFNFSLQGIDSSSKYQRLNEVFSNFEIEILLITRDVKSIIRSLYKEFVILGYDKNYTEFLKWIITFRDRNFLFDLNFKNKVQQVKEKIENSNVKVLSFENIVKDPSRIINEELSNWLDIRNLNLEIKNQHKSLTDIEVMNLFELNQDINYGISLGQDFPFEKHRNRIIYDQSEIDYSEKEIYSDVLIKRKNLEKCEQIDINQDKINQKLDLEEIIRQLVEHD